MATRIWVNGYYRKDGTYVKGHWKTTPDDSIYNNLSYKPAGTTYPSAGTSTSSVTPSGGGTTSTQPTSSGGTPTSVKKTLPNGLALNVVYWDNFLVSSDTRNAFVNAKDYAGPVRNVEKEFIGDAATEIVYGTTANDFINSGGGNDAVDGGPGDDVLDGGTGSNFLTGDSGKDTFFIDGRNGGVTWSTVTDLEAGEWVTAWGWREGVSKLTWQEMTGAEGYKGATARIDLDGNGSVDMSLTITGKHSGAILTVPSQVEGNGFLAFTLS